jgi:hypothetical protein
LPPSLPLSAFSSCLSHAFLLSASLSALVCALLLLSCALFLVCFPFPLLLPAVHPPCSSDVHLHTVLALIYTTLSLHNHSVSLV